MLGGRQSSGHVHRYPRGEVGVRLAKPLRIQHELVGVSQKDAIALRSSQQHRGSRDQDGQRKPLSPHFSSLLRSHHSCITRTKERESGLKNGKATKSFGANEE